MSTGFEINYKDISDTKLWKIFRKKSSDDEFVVAVGRVCEKGILKSKDIIRFFPNFTLHDLTHIRNVCNWMTALLGDRANELTAQDAAMLLMSACCHDIGMSVSAEQEKKLEEEYNSKAEQREYVRLHHHERVGEHLTPNVWNDKLDKDMHLQKNGITINDLLNLCKSHGKALKDLEVPTDKIEYDLRLCAVLLRLADILDFDSSRAPQSLFEHMGLDAPENFEQEISQLEWIKNSSGSFKIVDGELVYTARYNDPNIEHKVNEYLKWVKDEIDACREYISIYAGKWHDLRLPFKITPVIVRNGYEGGDFHITMDQERIINLLAGENLYSDSCVFVRELLQNSIDAILWRGENDPYFDAKKDGKIKITTWHDETGQGWFKIEDNGTGMDENIIKNYFLRAGRSYYTSDDFEKERDIYSHNKTYKPISRFGIGILSCFMSDKNNKLEVSTKRYSHDIAIKNPGLRLSVTGLKGYYSLAKENKPGVCDWQKMPVQKGEKEEYFRTEPGTTICVGMNLFDLGDYRSIKEVVDKYVQFPDMKVEYKGIDGPDTYPTKDELMEAVKKLKEEHGNNEPIVCKTCLTNEQFDILKEALPAVTWESRPIIINKYYPLNSCSKTGFINGVALFIDVEAKGKCEAIDFNGTKYYPKLKVRVKTLYDKNSIELNFSISIPRTIFEWINKLKKNPRFDSDKNFKEILKKYDRNNREYDTIISYNQALESLSGNERKVFKHVNESMERACITNIREDSLVEKAVISYNGVLSGVPEIFDEINYSCAVILLSGDYVPEVNVARDKITNLPLEAAFELGIIQRTVELNETNSLFTTDDYYLSYYSSDYLYLSEKALIDKLSIHPEWESEMWVNQGYRNPIFLLSETNEYINKKEYVQLFLSNFSLYENFILSFLKKNHSLCYDVENFRFILSEKLESSIDTSDFPAQLFFQFTNGSKLFGAVYYNIKAYSPEHKFSQWLIQNRENLEKQLPTVYRKILKIMIMSNDKTDVMKSINSILDQIKSYKYNYFGITDKIKLTKDDFA